jgi:hypothetical protein
MARPADLPYTEHFQQMPCGSRANYVAARCRCPKCRAANSRWVIDRDRAAKAAARALGVGPALSVGQAWTAPDGTKRIRQYRRACRGANGWPCPWRSHLRKDSSGDVCGRCRPKLAAAWNGLVPADAVRAHLKKLSRQGVGYKSVAIAADVGHGVLADILFHDKQQLRAQSARRVLAIDRDAVADHALVPAGPTWRRLRRLLAEGFTKTELARRLGSKAATPALQFRQRHVLAKTAARVERFYHIVMVA